eukprot:gene19384-23176_t
MATTAICIRVWHKKRTSGTFWDALYVDAKLVNISWTSLSTGQWHHVHFSCPEPLTDDLNVMSEVASGDSVRDGAQDDSFLKEENTDTIGVRFDGVDDTLDAPVIEATNGVSFWLLISPDQISQDQYLVDARWDSFQYYFYEGEIYGDRGGRLISSKFGVLGYDRLFVDGTERPREWSSLPTNRWTHVHLESDIPYSSRYVFMGAVPDSDPLSRNLAGNLGEIYYWDRVLSLPEVQEIATSAIGLLWRSGGRMLRDGYEVEVNWENVPTDSWGHITLEAAYNFNDNINIMSHVISGDESYPGVLAGNLKGRLCEAYVWDREIKYYEEYAIHDGFQYLEGIEGGYLSGLIAYYPIDEGVLSEVYAWNRPVSPDELHLIVYGPWYDYYGYGGLLSYFTLEEGEG